MPAHISLPLPGGCHCGAVRYELNAPPLTVYACHCANCQKIGGSAFSLSTIIPEAELSFTRGGAKRIEWTADSGTKRYGLFCSDCGSRLAHGQTPTNGFLSLRAGTLDETSWIEPVGHIWTKSAQPWFPFRPDDLLAEGQPADYRPFVERFRAQGRFAS